MLLSCLQDLSILVLMSHTLRPVDVNDLLLDLERAVTGALGESLPSSATTYVNYTSSEPAPDSTETSLSGTNDTGARTMSVRARVESMGSLPPMPPTVRGRAGRFLVSIANRLTWWQSTQAKEVAADLAEAVEGVAREVLELEARQQAIAGRVMQLESKLSQYEAFGSNVQFAQKHLETRVEGLASRVEEFPDTIAKQEAPEPMEDFFVFHQERFRGTREEIIERLAFFLPTIEQSPVAKARRPALDLGCGRGEWLQLLQQKNWPGYGVDTNARSIELCRALNLEVVQADAVQHLTEVPDGQLGAVTAFHLAEHLPFPQVIRLLRHAARSLAPGGLVILETPNPANRDVASLSFYLDPSHIAPLPSALLHVALEFTGFRDIRVVQLHPSELGGEAPGVGRDYGIIGFKG